MKKTIKQLREERGLTFYSLEKQMKEKGYTITRQNLKKYEDGEGMTVYTLKMFSAFYGVDFVVSADKPIVVIE